MKTMVKILTGVLIVSVIMYINKKNKFKETVNIETQTDSCTQETNYEIEEELILIKEEDEILNEEELMLIQEEDKISIEEELILNEEEDKILNEEEDIILNEEQIEEENMEVNFSELNNMNVCELKELAKQQDIKVVSRMKKADLIKILSS